MLRKFLYCYPEFLGLIKLFFYRIAFGRNFKFSVQSRFSSKSNIRIRPDSKITLSKYCHITDNITIRVADKGILTIGENTCIGQYSVLTCRNKIEIGNNVMIGPNVMIYDHDHDFRSTEIMNEGGYTDAPIIIEDNVWIGCGTIILKGTKISSGSVIAAGSLVTKNIPGNTLYYNKRIGIEREISSSNI